MSARVICGDARRVLARLPAGSVQCCVTSPPYWGLRDYGVPPSVWGGRKGCRHRFGGLQRGRRRDLLPADRSRSDGRLDCDQRQGRAGLDGGRFCCRCGAWCGCLGLEPTPELYVEHLVEVLEAVRRVLRKDGTLWLVLGDSYAAARPGRSFDQGEAWAGVPERGGRARSMMVKQKDPVGVSWLVAFALRARGWWLRCDVIWAKPAPMPESVRDRPTRSHEYVFLLAPAACYFYDAETIREGDCGRRSAIGYLREQRLSYRDRHGARGQAEQWLPGGGRNRRDVWRIAPQPARGKHLAAFPEALAEPCVLAGSSSGACGVCGAPYRRLVRVSGQSSSELLRERGHTGRLAGAMPGKPPHSLDFRGSHTELAARHRQTIGFTATCEHHDPTGRCVVLDPFCGSGTTGAVAAAHGRDFIGIELNTSYARLARKRIASAARRRR